jgi:hypothetical protein
VFLSVEKEKEIIFSDQSEQQSSRAATDSNQENRGISGVLPTSAQQEIR